MRVLIHSNSPATAQTGYGVQTRLFAPRIRDMGHEVAVSAFYGAEGAMQVWDGIPIYPRRNHPYGLDVVGNHAATHQADIVISLIDAWVMEPAAMSPRWVPWFPVDHDPMPEIVANKVREAWQPIVFSKHALASCEQAGISALYVPHGVDTSVYHPRERGDARDRLGIPRERFLVACVMANKGLPSRKAWPEQIEAFAGFARRHPDALLFLHTVMDQSMGGVNIAECLTSFGVPPEQVLIADQYRLVNGVPDEIIAHIYSAADVLLNCTMGEGFGVPILEAQACGCPVITGDWTAMSELTWAGWAVPREGATRWWTPQAAYQYLPHVHAIEAALEKSYLARHDAELRERASAGAQAYDADHVAEHYWRPALEAIEARIAAESGTAPAPPVEVMAA
ncbi:RfaG glycosyltransferase [Microcystis phage Mae-JY09]